MVGCGCQEKQCFLYTITDPTVSQVGMWAQNSTDGKVICGCVILLQWMCLHQTLEWEVFICFSLILYHPATLFNLGCKTNKSIPLLMLLLFSFSLLHERAFLWVSLAFLTPLTQPVEQSDLWGTYQYLQMEPCREPSLARHAHRAQGKEEEEGWRSKRGRRE